MEIDEDISVIEADPSKPISTTLTLKYIISHYIFMLYAYNINWTSVDM